MSIIDINKLSFYYDGSRDYIFKDVSFCLDTDWRLGFIGRNGRGKTTFLHLLLGKLEYTGSITSTTQFDYFPPKISDNSRDTMDVIKSICGDTEDWIILRELNLLDIGDDCLYRPFNTLSGGQQTKALLAALFIKENNFLLLDEPTNHLDAAATTTVCEYLSKKKGFILVSHDRLLLDKCTDHTLSINKCNIDIIKGNYSIWQATKDNRDNYEKAQNDKLKSEIGRLEEAAKRKSDWSMGAESEKIGSGPCDRGYIGHKAAKVMKTAKNIERRSSEAIEEKSKLLKNIESADPLKIFPVTHVKSRLIEVRDLSIAYDGHLVLSGFSMTAERGDRIAISGKNGSGKTSLTRLLAGEDGGNLRHSGSILRIGGLTVSYIPQDTSFLRGSLKDFISHCGADETLFRMNLAKLDVSSVSLDKDISYYSAGQQKKLLLAKSLSERANLYIWDEPLNYVDILTRLQIEELLLKYAPTLIFIQHDRVFTQKIATKKIEL